LSMRLSVSMLNWLWLEAMLMVCSRGNTQILVLSFNLSHVSSFRPLHGTSLPVAESSKHDELQIVIQNLLSTNCSCFCGEFLDNCLPCIFFLWVWTLKDLNCS
jgi:hypothetical protein